MANLIHPTAIVSPDVIMGDDNYIGPYVLLQGPVTIGDRNRVEGFCSVGTSPENAASWQKGAWLGVHIGDENIVREFVTINAGAEIDTRVGCRNIILRGAHIGHDTQVADDCILSCNVLVGGHSKLDWACNLGLGAILHQFTYVPVMAMIGMGCVVPRNAKLRAGYTYVGNPARELRANSVGLSRRNLSLDELRSLAQFTP